MTWQYLVVMVMVMVMVKMMMMMIVKMMMMMVTMMVMVMMVLMIVLMIVMIMVAIPILDRLRANQAQLRPHPTPRGVRHVDDVRQSVGVVEQRIGLHVIAGSEGKILPPRVRRLGFEAR